ncbi:MAG TPA: efflux transporter outer membrane subunit [Planctomycetota bacterium]|nr:efflux transporter outer membrane subunit [Planctomycetota bacterium]
MNYARLSFAAGLLALAACSVGPDYQKPVSSVPADWSEKGSALDPAASRVTTQAAQVAEWWKSFKDAELTSLMERAAQSNLDLKLAESRIREARGLRGVSAGALLPAVNASAGYSRNRESENVPIPGAGMQSNLYQAGFDASWELDVFGGIRRTVEAADAEVEASIEARRDVLVTLLAEVGRNYLEVRGFQAQIGIARQNLDAQKKTLELTQARFLAGRAAELDVVRAQAQVSTTASQLPVLENQRIQATHRLGVLLGREPGLLREELASVALIPAPPPEVPVGLPSELLRRRPDLRQAERELAAASARIGVATADLYPKFSLTGFFALESINASDFAKWGSRAWSVGPTIQWSIFQGGRIRARIEVENARQEQAAILYERSILVALQEVEDALVAYSQEQAHRVELSDSVAANVKAVDLANQRYTQGLVDFLSVLDAQRSLYVSQDALVLSERRISGDLVALYKALGGGWELELSGGGSR